ncbi:MAG: hypothetical protein ABIN61_05670 [candidate division WOR-3 bacterium]
MINLFVFVIFVYFPPIGGIPLENPEPGDITSKFLLQGVYQKWNIQSLDYKDPQKDLSYNYYVFIPERLYISFGCKSFNIIGGLEKSCSFAFKGNYIIKDNFYPFFFGVYTNNFLLRFSGAYGGLSSSDETVNFMQAGSEFLFFSQDNNNRRINFVSLGLKMLRSGLSDKIYVVGSLILGDEFPLLSGINLNSSFETGLKPYIFSYNIYNPEQGIWVRYSFFAELGIREREENYLWGISLAKKDLLTTGNIVGFSIGGIEIKGIYEFFLRDWGTGISLSYYFGGDKKVVKGNIMEIGLKLCRK